MPVLPSELLSIDLAKKCIPYWIFSKIKPRFLQNYRQHFFNHCVSSLFLVLTWYSTVQFCIWVLGTKTWYAETVIDCLFVWILLLNRLVSFQINLVTFFCHGINQHVFICWTSFTCIFPGNILAFQILWTASAKTWKSSVFSRKTNLPSSTTNGCISFIKVLIELLNTFWKIRKCHLVLPDPGDGNLIVGKCQKMHPRMIWLHNQNLFFAKQSAKFQTSRFQSRILKLHSSFS